MTAYDSRLAINAMRYHSQNIIADSDVDDKYVEEGVA
jgi:hypothetical protein